MAAYFMDDECSEDSAPETSPVRDEYGSHLLSSRGVVLSPEAGSPYDTSALFTPSPSPRPSPKLIREVPPVDTEVPIKRTKVTKELAPAPKPPVAAPLPLTSSKKPGKFRLNSKQLYLTYPKNDTTKEECLARIQAYFGSKLDWAVIAHEKHKDGDSHLHALVILKDRVNFSSFTTLDSFAGKHGDYRSAKSVTAVLQYVKKDTDYIEFNVDVTAFLKLRQNKKGSKLATSAAFLALKDGAEPLKILDEFPDFYFIHRRKIQEFSADLAVLNAAKGLKPWVPLDLATFVEPHDVTIATWLNENIKKPRARKQPQLYIYGDFNTGKTSLITSLATYLRTYYMPSEDFYDSYFNGAYDLCIYDEFKAHKTVQFLNAWLEGAPLPLRKKGSQYLKFENVPTIICSNYSVEACYTKADVYKVNTLKGRLTEVHIPPGSQINVWLRLNGQ